MPETIEVIRMRKRLPRLSPRSISPRRICCLLDGGKSGAPALERGPHAGSSDNLEGGTFRTGGPHGSGNLGVGYLVRSLANLPDQHVVGRLDAGATDGTGASGPAQRRV